ncbi:MAG: ABC transporter ATP-binding protein [Candidatus Sumerlaeota bacterium]|nr:ABC transporter ATP-binding protein [Candidatus Sumerlaeota bacterium]
MRSDASLAPLAPDTAGEGPLLSVRNLSTYFYTDAGVVKAVDDVSFDVGRAETVALVGESGCGKSVTAMSILRLIPMPPGRIVSGQILLEGEDLAQVSAERIRQIRGKDISMIFQEPMTSLNPVFTVGDQIIEAVMLHENLDYDPARERALRMLQLVGIPAPGQRLDEYPHQLSGGMRQRVMIAMALSCSPKLLIADEPTTALDVTVQAQILDLLRSLQKEFRRSILLITHDLGVVAEIARRVVVMYAGRIAEKANVYALFEQPRHPYTAGLFHSIPKLDIEEDTLHPIEGMVPDPLEFPAGCKFHPRCPYAFDRCRIEEPPLMSFGNDSRAAGEHVAACWHTQLHPDFDYLAAAGRAGQDKLAVAGNAGAGEGKAS